MAGRDPGRDYGAGRQARAPMPRRSRRRWKVAAGAAACWLALIVMTGSALTASVLLVVFAGLGVICVMGLRALGVTQNHPWLRRVVERPWRDGTDVLRLALRHLPDVLVVTPSGSLLAPDLVELRMNPRDLQSLSEQMDLSVASESATEVYEDEAAARGARLTGHVPPEVRIIGDSSVPVGRYQIRQGQPAGACAVPDLQRAMPDLQPAAAGAYAVPRVAPSPGRPAVRGPYPGFVGHDGNTRAHAGPGEPQTQREQPAGLAVTSGTATVAELTHRQIPVLRLVTGTSAAQTRTSGARAGRGAVELRLPEEPTLSREHARFTFRDGRWWISNLGRNGLTLNGALLEGEQALDDGDVIRWGRRWNALLSRVEIG